MYLRIVEIGKTRGVCDTPQHPYTEDFWQRFPELCRVLVGAIHTRGRHPRSFQTTCRVSISHAMPICQQICEEVYNWSKYQDNPITRLRQPLSRRAEPAPGLRSCSVTSHTQ